MQLDELPDGVLLVVLEKCTVQALSALAQTCTHLAKLVKLDVIWKKLCQKDYNVKEVGGIESYYCLYSQLLHHHGWMIGWFQCKTSYFDGLLEVKYSRGVLQGIAWSIPFDLYNDSLGKAVVFEIEVGQKNPLCLKFSYSYHRAKLRKVDHDTFNYICNNKFSHKYMDGILVGETCKRLNISNAEDLSKAVKLEVGPLSVENFKSGLFVSQCNEFGREIIFFSFNHINYELCGVKVACDQYDSSTGLPVKFDICFPIRPSLREQSSILTLVDNYSNLSELTVQEVSDHIFIVPSGCNQYGWEKDLPPMCKARFCGLCEDTYHVPSTSKHFDVHLVIFNNNLLGILWLPPQPVRFKVYQRKYVC